MKQYVVIISANQYQFTDEKTGELNEGTTVRYLITHDMAPVEDAKSGSKGYKPGKATMPYNFLENFKDAPIPGIYEASFVCNVDAKGKASINATDFTLVGGITISKATGKISLNKEA